MQFQTYMLNVTVVREKIEEISVLGSAYLAGLVVNIYNSLDDIKANAISKKRFKNKINETERNKYYQGWKKAIEKSRK